MGKGTIFNQINGNGTLHADCRILQLETSPVDDVYMVGICVIAGLYWAKRWLAYSPPLQCVLQLLAWDVALLLNICHLQKMQLSCLPNVYTYKQSFGLPKTKLVCWSQFGDGIYHKGALCLFNLKTLLFLMSFAASARAVVHQSHAVVINMACLVL
jgi:hypothetical protein